MSSVSGSSSYDSVSGSSYVSLYGSLGHDTLQNYSGSNGTIDGYAGNDYIYNGGSDVTVSGGEGNDYVYNYGNRTMIDGGADGDYVYNSGGIVTINGGEGNDIINNAGNGAAVLGGNGDDIIFSRTGSSSVGSVSSSYSSISSSSSYSSVSSSYSSLFGGAGNDTLYKATGDCEFFYGKNDGSDVIYNASSNDLVNLYDVSVNDIAALSTTENKISVNFNTGGSLEINSSENSSSTIKLSEGNVQFNHSTNTWQFV